MHSRTIGRLPHITYWRDEKANIMNFRMSVSEIAFTYGSHYYLSSLIAISKCSRYTISAYSNHVIVIVHFSLEYRRDDFNSANNKSIYCITLRFISSYYWLGNLRQMKNVFSDIPYSTDDPCAYVYFQHLDDYYLNHTPERVVCDNN